MLYFCVCLNYFMLFLKKARLLAVTLSQQLAGAVESEGCRNAVTKAGVGQASRARLGGCRASPEAQQGWAVGFYQCSLTGRGRGRKPVRGELAGGGGRHQPFIRVSSPSCWFFRIVCRTRGPKVCPRHIIGCPCHVICDLGTQKSKAKAAGGPWASTREPLLTTLLKRCQTHRHAAPHPALCDNGTRPCLLIEDGCSRASATPKPPPASPDEAEAGEVYGSSCQKNTAVGPQPRRRDFPPPPLSSLID